MAVAPCTIQINDLGPDELDIPIRAPFTVRFTRGPLPFEFDLILDTAQASNFRSRIQVGSTVTLKFTAPDAAGGPVVLESKNWHVCHIWDYRENMVRVRLADARWPLSYRKLTAQYNVKSYGGQWRPQSLKAGKPWTCLEAALSALEILGATVAVDDKLRGDRAQLPENMGNAQGGIWFGARVQEFLPAMLEPIRADLAVMPDGSLRIVDRVSAADSRIRAGELFNDGAGQLDRSWERPQVVTVQFRRRIERRFTLTDRTITSDELVMENICEVPDLTAIDRRPTYQEFGAFVQDKLGMTEAEVRKRFLAPQMVPDLGTNADQVFQRSVFQDIARRCWRRVWRPRPGTGDQASRNRARLADLTLGRLRADGTTDEHAVLCDWVEWRRVARAADPSNPATYRWTFNHPPGGTDNLSFGPFHARWIDPASDTFIIEDAPWSMYIEQAHIGRLTEQGHAKLSDPPFLRTGKIKFADHGEFSVRFRCYVYYHAMLVDRTPEGRGMVHEIEKPLFPNGGIDRLAVAVHDMTANHEIDPADPNFWLGLLMNETDLDARAEAIADRIKESYEEGVAGTVRHAGVVALAAGVGPGGVVAQAAVQAGYDSAWSITSEFVLAPALRSASVVPEDFQMSPAEVQ